MRSDNDKKTRNTNNSIHLEKEPRESVSCSIILMLSLYLVSSVHENDQNGKYVGDESMAMKRAMNDEQKKTKTN